MDVIMPQLGETVAEGTISIWHKKVGDEVAADELLFEIETDKVAMEIPAPVSGTLDEILVPEGETVEVGCKLAVINDGQEMQASASADAADETKPVSAVEPEQGRASEDKSQQLSPAVRKLLKEHQLEPSQIQGSGKKGRITRDDVLDFISTNSSAQQSSSAQENIIPFNIRRKVTAEHMVRSKAISAHVLQAIEIDFSQVDKTRQSLKESWRNREGFGLTYLPFIAYAICRAIDDFPHVNARIQDDALVLSSAVNLAIAVDVNFDGLVAPVIRDAQQKTVPDLARAISGLAKGARDNTLKPDDLNGGTYTISNSGSFGTLITAPIINQPQVAILSVDGVKKKPVVIESDDGDSIGIRPIGILAQSFDHRAIDGAYSAAFLTRIKEIIEGSDWQALV